MLTEYNKLQNYKKLLMKSSDSQTIIDDIDDTILIPLLLQLPHDTFQNILKKIEQKRVLQALDTAESNHAKHFLRRVKNSDTDFYNHIFNLLSPQTQHNMKLLLRYSEDEVGAFMHLELLSATTDETVDDVKKKMQEIGANNQHAPFIKLFVVTKKGHLLAALEIAELMQYEPTKTIEEIIAERKESKPLSISETSSINSAIELFETYELPTLPVVDKKGKLLGRILFNDVYTFIRNQEEAQALHMLGTHHQAEKSFFSAQRTRLIWIFINLCAILLSAAVVNHFKGTIEQIVTLAVLMPIVAALGGNVGNQAVTVTVRKLALNDLTKNVLFKIIGKEFFIGIVNGVIVGIVVGLLSYIWFHQEMLSFVVAIAIIIDLSLAGLIGSLLPILFKHFKIDPAIPSPLLLTTATDAMGFFLLLGLASVILL